MKVHLGARAGKPREALQATIDELLVVHILKRSEKNRLLQPHGLFAAEEVAVRTMHPLEIQPVSYPLALSLRS